MFEAELRKVPGTSVEAAAVLAGRTSVRVGGPAEFLVTVSTEAALCGVLDLCQQRGVPCQALGGGCNTIASDAGVRGVVLKIDPRLAPEQTAPTRSGLSLRLSAGAPIARIVSWAREHRLVGMEFLAGIPGTVGGAVTMNAGTRAGWLSGICAEVGICEPGGEPRRLDAAEVGFEYRSTRLPPQAVITWARVELSPGDVALSQKAIEADLAHRRRTQPLSLPNSGSVFRNPPGDHAARLIESCGLKGSRAGEAQISELHANFIVNLGQAKAADVLALMRRMQDAVFERHGVLLVPEVRFLGEFDPAELPKGAAAPPLPPTPSSSPLARGGEGAELEAKATVAGRKEG